MRLDPETLRHFPFLLRPLTNCVSLQEANYINPPFDPVTQPASYPERYFDFSRSLFIDPLLCHSSVLYSRSSLSLHPRTFHPTLNPPLMSQYLPQISSDSLEEKVVLITGMLSFVHCIVFRQSWLTKSRWRQWNRRESRAAVP